MYRSGLGSADILPVPPLITFQLPALPEATQRVIAQTQFPMFQAAEQAAARQFGEESWLARNSTYVLIGAGTLLALTLLKGRR